MVVVVVVREDGECATTSRIRPWCCGIVLNCGVNGTKAFVGVYHEQCHRTKVERSILDNVMMLGVQLLQEVALRFIVRCNDESFFGSQYSITKMKESVNVE